MGGGGGVPRKTKNPVLYLQHFLPLNHNRQHLLRCCEFKTRNAVAVRYFAKKCRTKICQKSSNIAKWSRVSKLFWLKVYEKVFVRNQHFRCTDAKLEFPCSVVSTFPSSRNWASKIKDQKLETIFELVKKVRIYFKLSKRQNLFIWKKHICVLARLKSFCRSMANSGSLAQFVLRLYTKFLLKMLRRALFTKFFLRKTYQSGTWSQLRLTARSPVYVKAQFVM